MTQPSLHDWSFRILQGRCVLCSAPSGRSLDLCSGCETDLPWIRNPCRYCSLPLSEGQTLCPTCRHTSPPFSAIICSLAFSLPVNAMINAFKQQGKLAEGKVLAAVTMARQRELLMRLADDHSIILPVPLHRSVARQRGFNQSFEIAKTVAGETRAPLITNTLVRVAAAPAQKKLSRKQRARNLAGVYECGSSLKGKRVILVDDVVTTMATVTEISRLLYRRGAEDVVVFSLARTPALGSQARRSGKTQQ